MPTTPKGRWSPDGSDGIDDLVADLAMMQTTNESAANALEAQITTPSVANEAARNTLFPAPTQGVRVFRRDFGWEEAYFAAYNASTNPGGATPAGWYPIAGAMPHLAIWRGTSSPINSGTWTNWQWTASTTIENRGGFSISTTTNTQILVPFRGWYDVSFKQEWGDGTVNVSDRFLRLASDGTAPFNDFQWLDRLDGSSTFSVIKDITMRLHVNTYVTTGLWHNDPSAIQAKNPVVSIRFAQPSI